MASQARGAKAGKVDLMSVVRAVQSVCDPYSHVPVRLCRRVRCTRAV